MRQPDPPNPLDEQLERLVRTRLLDPLEILLDDVPTELHGAMAERVANWGETLRNGSEAEVRSLVPRLIAALYPAMDRAFEPTAEWWRSPLGQIVVRRIGHPGAYAVTYTIAGAMLGITRQGVHHLLVHDKLERDPDGGVTVNSIRRRINERVHHPADPSSAGHQGVPGSESDS